MTPSGTEQFIQALQVAFEKGSLHKCTLSKPVKHAGSDLKNVYLRPVQLKKGLHLAFNFRYKTRDEVKNYLLEPALEELRNLLTNNFQNADLLTTERDFSLKISGNGKELFSQQKASQKDVPVMSHNREKQRLIDASSPWLYHLGITNSKGEVLAKSQDKWRQINKYLEIIQNLNAQTPLPKEPIIADMGSGKGYLTFALYDYLFNQLELKPQITGIELRKELVKTCNKAAENSGFDGLHFEALNISDYHPPRLDMLIALHACDVATDMALAGGIHANANMIIAAPCCHKQIRKEMSTQNELAPLLRHGILEERQAELITDGIRALLLESEGYQTKVFEFVSTEHTAKNVMITAVKSGKAVDKRREKSLDQIESIKSGFGIKKHYLETLLSKKNNMMRIAFTLFITALINGLYAQESGLSFAEEIEQHRQHYKQEFLDEPRSPLSAKDTAYLDFFPADESWKVTALFSPTPDEEVFDMPTYSGKTAQYRKYGTLTFEREGVSYVLCIYQNIRLLSMEKYQDYLFLPIKDSSNGETTYGGGRYLELTLGDIVERDGQAIMVLDFNKCFNPYCAYSDGYNCPVPPRENHLSIAVNAGEKMFKGKKKH